MYFCGAVVYCFLKVSTAIRHTSTTQLFTRADTVTVEIPGKKIISDKKRKTEKNKLKEFRYSYIVEKKL